MSYSIIYKDSPSTFIIRIIGPTTEQEVTDCFQEYYRRVKENPSDIKFNIIVNVDEQAHTSMAGRKLIRRSLENQPRREYISGIAAVNENPLTVETRNANNPGNILPFFINEEQALNYLSNKTAQE